MLPPFASNLLPLLQYYSAIQPFLTSVISNITSSVLEPPSSEGNAAGATIRGRAGPGPGPGAARPRPRPFPAGRPDPTRWGAQHRQHGPQKQQKLQQLFLLDYQAILIVLLTLYFSFRIVNVVRRIVMYWTILLVKTLFWGTVIGVLVLWMSSSSSSSTSSSSSDPSRHVKGLADASRIFASSVMDVTALIARWLQAGPSIPAAESAGAQNWWDGSAGRRREL